MAKGGGGGGGRGGGGGGRGGGGFRGGGGMRFGGGGGGRGGMRFGGGGFRHRFPRRFFGGGGAFFAPGGGWWGDGYPWYWYDWDYPLYLIEDEEEREEARKWREYLAMQAASQAATQAAQLAVQQVAKAKSTKGIGLGIFRPKDKTARPLGAVMPQWNALGVIFGNTTADPKVTETQKWLNAGLSKLGFTTLTVDGKLGAKTCGACAWAFGNTPEIDLTTAPQSFFEVWNICASSSQTPPTPLTQVAKTSAYTTGVQAMQAKVSDPKLVAAAQNALNVVLLANGMCALSVDGKAGPSTCGAQAWLIAHAGGDGLTQAQRDAIYPVCSVGAKVAPGPCPKPVTAAPVVAVIPTEAEPEKALVAPPKPKIAAATMIAGLGIAAALGALWYVYSQKKAAGA